MHATKNHLRAALHKAALLVLTFALLIPLTLIPATAYEVRYGYAADDLWSKGLFLGSSGTFNLDQPLDRASGVTMIVRLLGKDAEAKAGTYETPFTDVPAWAAPYVGYAYTKGITSGTSKTTFGTAVAMNANQFLTMTLRALGYDDKAGDFSYDKAPAKALELGLIGEPCYVEYTTADQFLRDNAAVIAYNALGLKLKGSDKTLAATITMPGKPAGEKPSYVKAAPVETPKPAAGPFSLTAAVYTGSTDTYRHYGSSGLEAGDAFQTYLKNQTNSDTLALEFLLAPTALLVQEFSQPYVSVHCGSQYNRPLAASSAVTVTDADVSAGRYIKVSLSMNKAELTKACGSSEHKLKIYLQGSDNVNLCQVYNIDLVIPFGGTDTPGTTPSGGAKTCSSCAGTGKRECTSCHGAGGTWGFRVEIDPATGRPQNKAVFNTCGICAGSGKQNCTTCGGTGTVK